VIRNLEVANEYSSPSVDADNGMGRFLYCGERLVFAARRHYFWCSDGRRGGIDAGFYVLPSREAQTCAEEHSDSILEQPFLHPTKVLEHRCSDRGDGRKHSAFRFLAMDAVSRKRFTAAEQQMQHAGFSDAEERQTALGWASNGLSKVPRALAALSG
jgi:hypothetical protein